MAVQAGLHHHQKRGKIITARLRHLRAAAAAAAAAAADCLPS